MFGQIIIFMSVLLIALVVPGLENSIEAIKSGGFLNEYVLKAIFSSYTFGVVSGYVIYVLLEKVINIRRKYLFFIQLIMSIVASFVMMIYTLGLMSV